MAYVYKWIAVTTMLVVKPGCHDFKITVEGCTMATSEVEAETIACAEIISCFKRKRKIIEFKILHREDLI